MKIIILTPFFLAVALLGLIISIMYHGQGECKQKGGMPVGYYGLDCWDDVNKTFIK